MDLKQFAKTYLELEEKVTEIVKMYGFGGYSLDAIEVEDFQQKFQLNVKLSMYQGGYEEYEWLTFDLDEMNNDIEYFEHKFKEEKEHKERVKKLEKEQKAENIRIQKEKQDEIDYNRLKLKFEQK
jgi:hypothetical protein